MGALQGKDLRRAGREGRGGREGREGGARRALREERGRCRTEIGPREERALRAWQRETARARERVASAVCANHRLLFIIYHIFWRSEAMSVSSRSLLCYL